MGVLDDLKRKAAAKANAPAPSCERRETDAEKIRAAGFPALFRIHQKLDELTAQLRILDEEIPVTLTLAGIGPTSGFVQHHYALESDGKPPHTVRWTCALTYADRRPLELSTAETPTNWVESMREQGLQTRVLSISPAAGVNQRATLSIDHPIHACLVFRLDVDRGGIELATTNFDEIGVRRQIFNPEDVTERWCEELLKFLLRRENRFLTKEVTVAVRAQLQKRLEWERQKKAAEEAARGAKNSGSRLKSLLTKRKDLTLRYNDDEWRLSQHLGAFTIGRVADCDLRIKDKRVSRFHARIEMRDGVYTLVDQSANGTQVQFSKGKSVNLHGDEMVLKGRGTITLGKIGAAGTLHIIYFSLGSGT